MTMCKCAPTYFDFGNDFICQVMILETTEISYIEINNKKQSDYVSSK